MSVKLVKESLDSFLAEESKDRGDVVLSRDSKFVKDQADHFPINSIEQGRNAWARVNQYDDKPGWYEGDLKSLIKKVKNAVQNKYPDIQINEMEGGKGDDLNSEDVDHDQLEVGIATEMEHTDDPEIAKEIALDHLAEDPKYYTKLVQAGLVDEPEALKLYRELLAQ